ncbi:MAG TPA: rod shape-determining protein MreC [Bacteroidales bacterium]|nr:rod shape-determining protein MreC [Bacteroidales bacterium]HOK74876.1 rod shape-determining protein MreC [Bacteroidales bacterium]HOM40666.1 rod shape-determining protein MreC [Bacteroidales bacterium]HOU30404.1 rod shape-determining protein MreC [Bacteroidales bacterium]HPP92767.1 rod shape-determining protein MreC [Bacteroidales bacterium]
MRNLLLFIVKYNRIILFILLEMIAVYLISNSYRYHNSQLIKGVRKLTLAWEGVITDTKNYLRIKKINDDLQAENTALWNLIEKNIIKTDSSFLQINDTASGAQYEVLPASVVNNSVNRIKNYFTIDRGKDDGVDVNMGVISPWGVAGITVASSNNYSIVMPVINTDFRLSSKIKSNDYFGSLIWDGKDNRYAVLNDIPQHVALNEGDTIVTTGYSAIFPPGIMVGTISEFKKSGSDFYSIKVRIATDFRKLTYVKVIRNKRQEEQLNLEKGFQ